MILDLRGMVICDGLDELTGEVPALRQPLAGLAVIDVEELALTFEFVEMVLPRHFQKIAVFVGIASEQLEQRVVP